MSLGCEFWECRGAILSSRPGSSLPTMPICTQKVAPVLDADGLDPTLAFVPTRLDCKQFVLPYRNPELVRIHNTETRASAETVRCLRELTVSPLSRGLAELLSLL